MKVSLSKTFRIEAAHRLPHLPKKHKCSRLHGHSFRVEIRVEGACDSRKGWLIDYSEIKKAFKPIFDQLDHHCLNDIPGLEIPTSENLAKWIWNRLKRRLPLLAAIAVIETPASRAEYRGKH
jgi:6-pyruvoyltetrahydropterin/6-carboxytetrahydropterin synthase